MLLLIRFMYGGEVTVPLKQLGDLQDLIQLLQLDPGHVNGKFVIENTHDKTITANIPATITVVSPPTESTVSTGTCSSIPRRFHRKSVHSSELIRNDISFQVAEFRKFPFSFKGRNEF